MDKVVRWAGYGVGAVVVAALFGIAWLWYASSQKLQAKDYPSLERLVSPTPAQLADGPRQLRILGCISCHGEGLRGRTMFDKPMVARLQAPNLTLIAAHATDQQLAQAIRQGVGHDGRSLFAMPSAEYSRLTDGEVAALIAAIRAQPRGGTQTPPLEVGPLGRLGIVSGQLKSQPQLVEEYRINLPRELGPEFARGRHIALTTCSGCHGPTFAGAEPEPGLVAPSLDMVAAYDLAAFKKLIREGVPSGGRKLRLMDGVARDNFSRFTDSEVAALHAYLVERAQRQ